MTRQKVKRQLLDAIDEAYKFDAPQGLISAEFDNIWKQVTNELEQAGKTFADEDTTEEQAREEYQRLAERRVRLGLVLAEIGDKANVEVTDEEMQRGLYDTMRRYPQHQQQEVLSFYRNNPQALAGIRAPIFEEKVIDHLMTQVQIADKKVSREELMADEDESAEGEKAASDKQAAEPAKAEDDGEAAEAKKPAAGDKATAKAEE